MLRALVLKLEARIDELERLLKRNSTNSSTPPSKDALNVVRRLKAKSKKKRGGQPGHKGHFRSRIANPDMLKLYPITGACMCGCSDVIDERISRRHQVSELPVLKAIVTEYQAIQGRCANCNRIRKSQIPDHVTTSCIGPNMQAMLAALCGRFLLSKRDLMESAQIIFGITLSLGTVSNNEHRVSKALAPVYDEVNQALMAEPKVNVDETGHQRIATTTWIWLKSTPLHAVFAVGFQRSRAVYMDFLGHGYDGCVSTDRYPVYNVIDENKHQFCWAHIIRNFKALSEEKGIAGMLGRKMLRTARLVIKAHHQWQQSVLNWDAFSRRIQKRRKRLESLLAQNYLFFPKMKTLAYSFLLERHESWWLFATKIGAELDIEPTNNRAERDLRRIVLYKRKSFFTQSIRGDVFLERIFTVVTSCTKQTRNCIEFIADAVNARLWQTKAPTLVA